MLDALDARFPGIRFRMVDERGLLRPHMRCFVAGRAVHDLSRPMANGEELHIVQALSGGGALAWLFTRPPAGLGAAEGEGLGHASAFAIARGRCTGGAC